jgi:hypothetical protein
MPGGNQRISGNHPLRKEDGLEVYLLEGFRNRGLLYEYIFLLPISILYY